MYNNFHGELLNNIYMDQVLRDYFNDYNYKGVFFDVGAYEPINISNSYHFEKNDWNVYCFEANTMLIPDLKMHRKNIFNYAIADINKDLVEFNVCHGSWGGGSFTAGVSAINLDPQYMKTFGHGVHSIEKIQVPQKTLNSIIEQEIGDINQIDILQIDVEGGELNVLKGLNIEKYKPKLIMVEDIFEDKNLNEYIINFGYKLDKKILYNKFYVLN